MRVDIKKNDTVKVIAGRDRGKQGRVLSVDRVKGRLLVEHVRRLDEHSQLILQSASTDNSPGTPGSTSMVSQPVHVSTNLSSLPFGSLSCLRHGLMTAALT